MPRSVFGAAYNFLDRKELLSFEEIERVARAFVANGVTKLRITGGEPLVRRQIEHLIEKLAGIDGDVSLTTNGALLTVRGLNSSATRVKSIDCRRTGRRHLQTDQ